MSAADNLCKEFGPRSGPTECQSLPESKHSNTVIVFLKEFFEKVNFEKSADDSKRMIIYPACKELIFWLKIRIFDATTNALGNDTA